MKTTNRLIGLFAAILTTATLMAEVVYEHMLIDSGFNRDVIAESYPIIAIPAENGNAISYLRPSGITYTFATQEVIRTVNTNYNVSHPGYFSVRDLDSTELTGWPNDPDDKPENRIIRVVEDAKSDPNYRDVTWQLASYRHPNVLTMRPDNIIGGTGTLKFKKVGSYSKLYFLLASAKEGGASSPRTVYTTVRYTDGTTDEATFSFAGLSGLTGHNVRKINIYEDRYKKNCQDVSEDKNKAFAAVFDMEVDNSKLIHRIDFENKLSNSAVIILAVTGVTADIATPDAEEATVSNIEKTSFQACWDAITEAASYRIDVATDIDFQHILEDYNNLPVSGSTCQDIVDLVSNTDYYWRVRAVNSDGGQSASSSPHRVTTAPDPEKGDTPPYTDETYTNIEENLAQYIGTKSTLAEIDIHRTLYRDGAFNTLCLPFDLNAEEIAASPLVGAQVYEFVHAEKNPSGHLDIEISGPIDHITAGVPYLVKWAPTTPEVIDGGILVFKNVNVVTNHGQTLGGEDEVKFVGNIGIAHLVEEEQLGLDHNKLFLGAENTLYWPQYNTNLKGFRAYFLVPDGPSGAPKNTPARIIERHETATGMEIVESQKSKVESKKLIINGQLYILHNGTMYNVQGQVVKR